ncbi:hypothetical protein [Aeoliella sp.]|uniref:hypothetical protein n=1 Tax=Aeoliella sp. TaxID=2795800 RepID=UPI003CCBD894
MQRRITRTEFLRIEKLLADSGQSMSAIARSEGVSNTTVRAIRDGSHPFQRPPEELRSPPGQLERYLPTPEEIAEQCVMLRRRRHPEQPAWEFPVVSASLLQL